MLDNKSIKKDFPIFTHHPNLVYLDSAATSLKPQSVIDKMVEYYSHYCANIHRGIYQLSEKATKEYEETRQMIAHFIGAKHPEEIIFTRNATESLNLIAYSLGRELVNKNDEIVTTIMEHHSNFVPWQMLAREKKAGLKIIDIDDNGVLKDDLDTIISEKTKILTFTYVSNVLGTINPVKEIIAQAKKLHPNIIAVIDCAKAAPCMLINVKHTGADFVVFSLHKMLGPTGVGVLWGKKQLLDRMQPFQYGGGTIREVSLGKTTFADSPHKFEAGTPHIAGVIAASETIKYLSAIGMENIQEHEQSLAAYAMKRLQDAFSDDIHIYGPKEKKLRSGLVSFNFRNYHPHDVAQILDEDDIAIRAGHHCVMPLHKRLAVTATARASFYIYNDEDDVKKLIFGLKKVKKILG